MDGVFLDFIGYIPNEEEGGIMEGTVIIIPCVDAWICSFSKLLIMKDYRAVVVRNISTKYVPSM